MYFAGRRRRTEEGGERRSREAERQRGREAESGRWIKFGPSQTLEVFFGVFLLSFFFPPFFFPSEVWSLELGAWIDWIELDNQA